MGAWPNQGSASSDATNGGRQRPPYRAHCAECYRRRSTEDMVIEANERSGAFGFLVCRECYEGPYPDLIKPAKADDTGPLENVFYL